MNLILALLTATVVYVHADKPITAANGSHVVVLSERAEYIDYQGVKNYLVYAINDRFPTRHFIVSLSETECKDGKGSLVLAEETGPETINILDMKDWNAAGTEPQDEIGRAVCEVGAKGSPKEHKMPDGAGKKSVRLVDPMSGRLNRNVYPL